MFDATILRLIISQIFAVYFLLILIPLKEPHKKNTIIISVAAVMIVTINAFIIAYLGIDFYIRFYFLTLLLPYIALFSYLSLYKWYIFIFGLLSIQVIGNVAIINGLFAAYLYHGGNHPLIDMIARVTTYILFLPIFYKFIRPTFLKMAELLNKGWWILNASLILSYVLAYYILFVPDNIFNRPEYFIHAYIGIILSLFIYAIIFFLFIEVQSKVEIERDKKLLSSQITTLAAESEHMITIAYMDTLTGVKNRYSLFRQMDQLISNHIDFLIVFIDLDNLKIINDTYDHSKGDAYLKQFAQALKTSVHDQGDVYRFAGDEFVCLYTQEINDFNIDRFKATVKKEMMIDVPYEGMSLGLAYYPKDGINSDDLISLADQMMYAEKKAKKIRR